MQQALQATDTKNLPGEQGDTRYTRAGRQTKNQPCNVCQDRIPSFVAECSHRICGECAISLIRRMEDCIPCPCCSDGESLIPIYLIGQFIDSLMEVDA